MYAGFAEASYTETITDNSTTIETGNSISGTYTSTASDTTTTTDTDVYSNSSGTVTVTEWSSQTTTTTTTGNNISTAYTTVTNTAGQSYTMTETGSDFTLTETGSLSSNSTGSGNTIEGTFSTNTTGTDNYTMHEHGINTDSQSFCQSITGTDEYTISETGNNANQTDSRDISGSGSYSELLVVASSPTVLSGDYNLSNDENADARSGALSQSGDLGRYALLEYFVDVSNADASSPGNMDFSPVGQAFVDGNAASVDEDSLMPVGAELSQAAQQPMAAPSALAWWAYRGNDQAPSFYIVEIAGITYECNLNTLTWTINGPLGPFPMPIGWTPPVSVPALPAPRNPIPPLDQPQRQNRFGGPTPTLPTFPSTFPSPGIFTPNTFRYSIPGWEERAVNALGAIGSHVGYMSPRDLGDQRNRASGGIITYTPTPPPPPQYR